MICEIDDSGICLRHKRAHIGHAQVIATDTSEYAEAVRKVWDKPARITSPRGDSPTTAHACPHLGKLLDTTSCGKKVYQCNLFKETVSPMKAACGPGMRYCGECTSRPGLHRSTPVADIIPWMDANPDDTDDPPAHMAGWWTWPNVQEAFRQAIPGWAASTPAMPDFARLGYADHGVVMVGGGERYEIGLYVACSMLRKHGYTGRIQLWHRGQVESINHNVFAGLDVEIIDAFAYLGQSERTQCRRWGMWRWATDPLNRWGGWGLKSYAVLHSPFVNVFYQDADWYLRADASRLMRCLDKSREHGSVVWYDNNEWGNDYELKFDLHGVKPDLEGKGFQGGQWIVNKANPKAWQALNLFRKLDDYSDYYYRHHFGDQDSMRLAWAVTDCPRFAFRGRCAVRAGGYLAHDDRGFIGVHRINDKQFHSWTSLPAESQAHDLAHSYRRHVATMSV